MNQSTKVKTYVGIGLLVMMVISGLIASTSSDAPTKTTATQTQQTGW